MLSVESIWNQAKEANLALQQKVPGYKSLNEATCYWYGFSKDQVQAIVLLADISCWQKTTQAAIKKGKVAIQGIQATIHTKTDAVLAKVEDSIQVQKDQESLAARSPTCRIIAIFWRLNQIIVIRQSESLKCYSMAVLQKGKKMVYVNCLPIYITLKATTMVTKEMMVQALESRIHDMKVSYESSKDTVTMMIAGKFNEDQIKEKVQEGMKSFQQFTVNVVHKGLEIKVDGKSLRENYDVFAIKFLDIVKNMRQKGTTEIASVKERSMSMYHEVINRIKEKEIQVRLDYTLEKAVE